MSKTRKRIKNESGFTLVELMVTVFLTAIAVISIYRGYTSFSQAADAQQQVMEMQQNLRIGMMRLIADIRRAGMNEEDENVAGFIAADATSIEFSMDLGSGGVFATDGEDNDGDGVTDNPADSDAATAALEAEEEGRIGDGDVDDDGERIKYYLAASTLDPTTNDLKRDVWDADKLPDPDYVAQTLITNVEALDFVYWDAGSPGASPQILTSPLNAGDLDIVDRVEITLVVRTTNEDYRYTDREPYPNLQGTPLVSNVRDNFRRRVFSMSVQIRNNI